MMFTDDSDGLIPSVSVHPANIQFLLLLLLSIFITNRWVEIIGVNSVARFFIFILLQFGRAAAWTSVPSDSFLCLNKPSVDSHFVRCVWVCEAPVCDGPERERERFTVVVFISAVFWFPFFEWRTQTISTCWFGELTPLSCRNIRASWPSAVVFVVCSGAEAQETWGDTAVGVHHLRFTAVDLVSAGPKLSCVFFC